MLDIKTLVIDHGMNNLLKSIIDYLNAEQFLNNDKARQLRKDLWTALETYDSRFGEHYIKPTQVISKPKPKPKESPKPPKAASKKKK